jgi:hypothetical protein
MRVCMCEQTRTQGKIRHYTRLHVYFGAWSSLSVYMYTCMCVYTKLKLRRKQQRLQSLYVCMYVCIHACIYVCMYASMYVCMYVRNHIPLNEMLV